MRIGSKVPFVGQDIRQVKQELREKYKRMRRELPAQRKAQMDASILQRLIATAEYRKAQGLVVYVSTPIEVDTHALIRKAWADGKRVIVPRCVVESTSMDFYEIRSFADLEKSTYGLLEPREDACRKVTRFSNTVCIVPGLSFDTRGYRLGYGKGYYDRFLSNYYGGATIGLCYCCCLSNRLYNGRYDRAVDFIITEKYVKRRMREDE